MMVVSFICFQVSSSVFLLKGIKSKNGYGGEES